MSIHATAHALVFNQAHSIVFLSDNLRNTLREVIRENGLSPQKLVQDWATIERGIQKWLESGHLNNIVVEFFKPGANIASKRPTTDCTYRILLCTDAGAPTVSGFTSCSFLATGQMAARQAGTVISTGHLQQIQQSH